MTPIPGQGWDRLSGTELCTAKFQSATFLPKGIRNKLLFWVSTQHLVGKVRTFEFRQEWNQFIRSLQVWCLYFKNCNSKESTKQSAVTAPQLPAWNLKLCFMISVTFSASSAEECSLSPYSALTPQSKYKYACVSNAQGVWWNDITYCDEGFNPKILIRLFSFSFWIYCILSTTYFIS